MSKKRVLIAVRLAALVALCLLHAADPAAAERDREREAMVREQIIARGVHDPVTLAALRQVPRHMFVPESRSWYAYDDRPLPIGYGQTISQPFIVAYMTKLVQPGPQRKILEIGTGSGYQAAVLAAAGADVYSIELIPQLAELARKQLNQAGYTQIQTRNADGYFGWPEAAPFDAIVVTAAAEYIPPPLLEQLIDGGMMVIPVGSPFFTQSLLLVQKQGQKVVTSSLMPVRFVPFRRAE